MTQKNSRLAFTGLTAALGLSVGLALVADSAGAQSRPRALPNVSQRLAEPPLVYRVNEGDTLIDVARKYLRHPLDYRYLQRDNNIANPRAIPIGRMINIDTALLRTRADPARLDSYRGDVQVIRNGQSVPLSVGMELRENDSIATGGNSFVRITFSDDSRSVMPSNSRLRLERLRRFVINNQPDHRLVVENGRVENRVTPRQSPGAFRVTTPTAISAVRGTDFRVAYDAASRISATSVLEGAVAVAPDAGRDADAALVRDGSGVSTAEGQTSLTASALLPAPALVSEDSLQTAQTLSFRTTTQGNASIVRGWIGQDAGLTDPIAELEAPASDGVLRLTDLPEGRWYLRLSAVDTNLIEGRTRTYDFIRALNTIEGLESSSELKGRERIFRFGWSAAGEGNAQFRFQLFATDEDGTPVGDPMIDTPGLTESFFTLSNLPAGNYSWRVESARYRFGHRLSAWSKPELLTISR